MTREEQIMNFVETQYKKLALGNPDGLTPEGKGYLVGLGDILRFYDTLPKESEPQGLDEVAEELNSQELLQQIKENHIPMNLVKAIFEAGAKSMAEQGIAAEAIVCKLLERAWITPIDEKKFQQDVFDNFAAGDNVIVQIRKI